MARMVKRQLSIVLTTAMCLAATGVSMLISAASHAGDPRAVAYGRHLSQECTSCHRLDGVDNGIPSIVGQDPAIFAETLGYYRTGARTNAAMVSVAQSLDDEQVNALAQYYATLPKPASNKGQRKAP